MDRVGRGLRGNCYVATEALYHLLPPGWQPMHMRWEGESHWFLKHEANGMILDPTALQFNHTPDYSKAVGKGFLTKQPSKRAALLMRKILWQ
jgi:hypothetical protein